jgi:class 3 adenylate cyclase
LSSFEEILEQKIAAIASLGVTFTSYAKKQLEQTNTSWPFVTMNDFQQRAASATSLSKAYFLEVLPIVTDENRVEWEEYSVANKEWLSEGRVYQARNGLGTTTRRNLQLDEGDAVTGDVVLTFTEGESSVSGKIFTFDDTFAVVSDPGPGPYYPIWQSAPILPEPRDLVNYNLVDYGGYGPYINLTATTGQIAIGGLDVAAEGGITHPDLTTSFFAYILSFQAGQWVNYTGDPMSSVYVPVVDSFGDDRKPVAVLVVIINWATYFENTLPLNSKPVAVVLENTCDGPFTYEVSGDGVVYLGKGNLADPKYESMKQVVSLDNNTFVAEATTIALTLNQDLCQYSLSVYPTQEMDDFYNDRFPLHITVVIAAVFILTAGVFSLYDLSVEKRQTVILDTAKRSAAIVSSIFPNKVRDQLMEAPVQGNATKLRSLMRTPLKGEDLMPGQREGTGISSRPIADLFPDCTVFFGDVEGFTAWSSIREPSQVFILLETIYAGFDRIAAKRKVFKVETVGDCYVAVAGLPDKCQDHAVVMARFARDCIAEHITLTKQLEVTLGPDTGDLRIRIGLHSGPITAGVLRGERSRFQLFGDTVNTASRLESAGRGNDIHISEQTANLLIVAGHKGWIQPREDVVHLKGKGSLKTFWLLNHATSNNSNTGTVKSTLPSQLVGDVDSKTDRLIRWNVGK